MRKNFGSKPVMYPMPVLILGTYDEHGTPNAMTAAWAGIADVDLVSVCLDKGHKSTQNIFLKKGFTISFATEDFVVEADYLGIVSGNKVPDKVAKSGLHPFPAEHVDAPLFEELPAALECEFVSYDPNTGLVLARIVNLSADESVLTDGKVDILKLRPISYDPVYHGYYATGRKVGQAYTDGKKLK